MRKSFRIHSFVTSNEEHIGLKIFLDDIQHLLVEKINVDVDNLWYSKQRSGQTDTDLSEPIIITTRQGQHDSKKKYCVLDGNNRTVRLVSDGETSLVAYHVEFEKLLEYANKR